MVDRHLAAAKLAELAERISRVRRCCPASLDGLRRDRDALDLVSFNLMLAVQSCSDLASYLIAAERWSPVPNLAAAFDRLCDQGVIAGPTADALRKAVGLRNVVAHGYSGINPAMVFVAATEGLRDLQRFAREVAAWVSSRGASDDAG